MAHSGRPGSRSMFAIGGGADIEHCGVRNRTTSLVRTQKAARLAGRLSADEPLGRSELEAGC